MTQFIAIDGRGGSGKSHLSHLLEKELGVNAYHLDDYGDDYKPFIGIPKLIEELENSEDPIVLFEGIGVFKEQFDKFNAFKIFVDTPEAIRESRATGRDVPRADRTAEDWKNIWAIWTIAEKDYFTDALKGKANLIVGSSDGKFNIEAIKLELAQKGL